MVNGMITRNEIAELPAGLESLPPGPELFDALLSTAGTDVDAYDRVVLVAARQRLISWLQAQSYGDMAAVVDEMHDLFDEFRDAVHPVEAAADEIGAALHLTRTGAITEVGLALDLRDRLPKVGALLAAGEIDARRAAKMADATSHLPQDTAREVVDRVADQVPEWTTGQIGARLRKLCIDVDPESAAERYAQRVAGRRVLAGLNPDGAMDIWAHDLPADRAAEAMNRVDHLARLLNTGAEVRSMDELRADVLLDLLCGDTDLIAKTGSVDITVDLATLAGLADHPGELGGYGPVIADIVRQVAAVSPRATWEWSAWCTGCGEVVDAGTTRRRPTAGQSRRVRTRDRRCVFPGCRRPARECDLDHIDDWIRTGRTSACGLAPLCRYHHLRKHRGGWTYERLPNGDYRWRSPLGHTYLRSREPP